MNGHCVNARRAKVEIERMMAIPFVQGSLRFAYQSDRLRDNERNEAEGASFAAAVLPLVYSCSHASAQMIYDMLKVGGDTTDYMDVRRAFEQVYKCMDLTCEDIGGLWNDGKSEYYADAGPCTTTSDEHRLGVALGSTISALFVVTFAGICF